METCSNYAEDPAICDDVGEPKGQCLHCGGKEHEHGATPPPSGFAAAIAAHYAPGQKTRLNMTSDLRLPPAPSLRTLAAAFGDDAAPLMRRILKSRSRTELLALSSDAADLERRSYGRQSMQTIRFVALNQVLGGYDAESFRTRKGEWVTYVNMGDTYNVTILKFRGTYRVSDWGSIAEKHGDWQG